MRVRSGLVALCFAVVFATIANAFEFSTAHGATLQQRKLTLVANGAVGGSTPGGIVNHQFTFTVPTAGNVGSIKFEYCTTAADAPLQTCVVPTGLVTTASTMGTQTGATGFTLVNTTNGAPYVTRTAASVAVNTVVSIQLNGVTNPTATNSTFYVRVTTYDAAALGGNAVDSGTVAASTATQIVLSGIMPESLIFCTGATVPNSGTPSYIPNCAGATSGAINFDRLFSPSDTAIATSQMAASTNAQYGYVITVNGPTMTSGSNTIASMATAGASTRGTAQFGMNLKANTTAVATVTAPQTLGAEITNTSDGIDRRGRSLTGYNTVDTFKFVSGDSVADSASGGAGPTNGQTYTSTYIVNVPGNQLPGTYVSTITYICTPTF